MAVRDFLLPDLGEGLEDAEVARWLVAEGDRVERNQPLAELNTAKALVEVPSPYAGVVVRRHAAEGELVKVGAPLVSIEEGAEGKASGDGASAGPARPAVLIGSGPTGAGETVRPRVGAEVRPHGGPDRGPVPASPPIRRLAKELGVDLRAVTGTGPGGRVTREDVTGAAAGTRAAAPAAPAATGAGAGPRVARAMPVRGTRRIIAERLTRSVREIPQATTFLTLDATILEAYRREVGAEAGRPLGPLPVLVRALAGICGTFPELNASFEAGRGEIVLYADVNVGIATDTDRGLVIPVVRGAGDRGVLDVAAEIARLAEAARDGTIAPADLAGATITVTNVGSFGAEFGTPVIDPPQAAILALGAVAPRPLVVDGAVVARPAATLGLTFDHRVLDGAEAGRALAALVEILQDPFKLGALPR